MTSRSDQDRLRREYADRKVRLAGSNLYSPFNLANLFIRHQRQRAELALLGKLGFDQLYSQRILEVGCGRGGNLLTYLGYGAEPNLVHGTDLLLDRVQDAHTLLPNIGLTCADGQHLPYASHSFDMILQYTVFSSILDDQIKQNLAREMLRVLIPTGLILWYDFWINPTNPHTQGIRPSEIRQLFPACQYAFRRITLAPPITRRMSKVSWLLCYLLERVTILNTHYLVAIQKSLPD